MFYILNLCEIIYWLIRVVHFNYSPHTYHMLYIKTICQTICVYEALMPFPHGQVLQLSWSPKAELILRLLFFPGLPSPGGFPLTCVPTSQVYHCIVFLAPCWYESSFFYQKCCLVIWFTEYPFPSLFKDLSLHHPFFYSDFRELHQLCNFLPSLLRNCLFPRYHFSVMISKEFSVSFHPQAFKISSPNNFFFCVKLWS